MPPFIEVFLSCLKLGFTAFGGPAAHIGMFRDEFVRRRKWLTDDAFLDLLGATNLIPGPNSTEMTIHIGYLHGGWAGLIAGGLGFILPATLIVLAFAWAYVKFASMPQASWLLYGIKPVTIAIILQALWVLGNKAIKGRSALAVAAASVALYFFGVNEVLLLFVGGFAFMLIKNRTCLHRLTPVFFVPLSTIPWFTPAAFSLSTLFLTFLKIGSILYGSGYVLVAFLRADFVERLGWLTENQLIDAIAIGQITPGPLFTSATFIGYLLGGIPAALIATLGIFLPSYLFVVISTPIIPKMRQSLWVGGLLDGVIIASLGLMAAVTVQLGQAALVDFPTVIIFTLSAFLLFRHKASSTWLILSGAIVGFLISLR